MSEPKGWKELPMAGLILEPGSAAKYQSGTWRTQRPVHYPDKCKHCLSCWIYCPESAVQVNDEKVVGIDFDHCKGCGICAEVCPVKDKAIEMVPEEE